MSGSLLILAAIAVSTFASEDLTTIAAGLLVRDGKISLLAAVSACAAGIYVGDMAIWMAARLLGPLLLQRVPRLAALSNRWIGAPLDGHLGVIVLASRFVPGSRVALCVAAGLWGRRGAAFAAWALVAAVGWTSLVIGVSVGFASAVAAIAPAGGIGGAAVRVGLTLTAAWALLATARRGLRVRPRAVLRPCARGRRVLDAPTRGDVVVGEKSR